MELLPSLLLTGIGGPLSSFGVLCELKKMDVPIMSGAKENFWAVITV